MQYIFLIYTSESSDDENPEVLQRYFDYTRMLRERGAFIAGDALMPTSTATSLRKRDGALLTTDGPFAETKEQLGGYYLVQCADLDEALELASHIPACETGTVEVRPLVVFS